VIDLDAAQRLADHAVEAMAEHTSIPFDVRAGVSLLHLLVAELRDARTALAAPELHQDCRRREEQFERGLRELKARVQAIADTMDYSR
jgi:hypothetical protein